MPFPDSLPSPFRAKREQLDDNIQELFACAEFLPVAEFASVAMLCGTLHAKLNPNLDNSAYVLSSLNGSNQALWQSHQKPYEQVEPVVHEAADAMQKAERLYFVLTTACKHVDECIASGTSPQFEQLYGDPLAKTVGIKDSMATLILNKELQAKYKQDPVALRDTMAKAALNVDYEISKHELTVAVMTTLRLSGSAAGRKWGIAEQSKIWQDLNDRLYNEGAFKQSGHFGKYILVKTVLQDIAAFITEVSASKDVSKLKKESEIYAFQQFKEMGLLLDERLDHTLTANAGLLTSIVPAETTFEELIAGTRALITPHDSSKRIGHEDANRPESGPETDPQIEAAGLLALASTVQSEHAQLRNVWVVSKKQLKTTGFIEFAKQLQIRQGNWKGVVDTEASELAGSIVRLKGLADDGGRIALEAVLSVEHFLEQQWQVAVDGLIEIAAEGRPVARPNQLPTIVNDVVKVHQNWNVLRPLLEQYGPTGQQADIICKVEKMLGIGIETNADTSVAVTPTPLVEPAEMLNPHLIEVAEQLDWEAFPVDVTIEAVKDKIGQNYKKADIERVEWQRIENLLELAATFEGTLYRSKPRALGSKPPYFIAEIIVRGQKIAIADNPVYGNATYMLREDQAAYGATWQQVFSESRAMARILGAIQVTHSEYDHMAKMLTRIQDLLTSTVKR